MTIERFATDPATLARVFDTDQDLLPLWVAEPDLPLAPAVVAAVQDRASTPWYGYEARPRAIRDSFHAWMLARHGWETSDLHTIVSPSIGTSIGVLLDLVTEPGDGVVLQPPVFTDFKPLVASRGRQVVRNALVESHGRYGMDLPGLAQAAAAPTTRALVLCNPHNPVGRCWTFEELRGLATVCAEAGVVVVADEIHADLALPGHTWTPFAKAAAGTGARWAALHGPIKTFGLAGLCDTFLLTDDEQLATGFREVSDRLHLVRNNVIGMAAAHAGYASGGPWLDDLVRTTAANLALLEAGLPEPLKLVPTEGTYLAWLDLRGLGLEVPELARWLTDAGLALSPGHWFGREGAGFARMTVAVQPTTIEEALTRLERAVPSRR